MLSFRSMESTWPISKLSHFIFILDLAAGVAYIFNAANAESGESSYNQVLSL
ncbi:MAG: hypothetical protein ACD_3C00200G0002 [uncultured bacterium (gcode 4)]|uniref:Uncharacterized protein n=1 Tax=uncultured bacterium (gcode 4) TaxID=1234023 RepID=K2FX00_9BACT|nr:MAG: hypothetical protein ACD_3C00200G0002 [uncultured bacterium (gcode 4)]